MEIEQLKRHECTDYRDCASEMTMERLSMKTRTESQQSTTHLIGGPFQAWKIKIPCRFLLQGKIWAGAVKSLSLDNLVVKARQVQPKPGTPIELVLRIFGLDMHLEGTVHSRNGHGRSVFQVDLAPASRHQLTCLKWKLAKVPTS